MARLIDSDKVENQIQRLIVQTRTDPNDRIERLMESSFKLCLDIVREAPTIDPKTLKPKAYKGEIGEAMENIEDVLDTLTEVGNGATDEEVWKAGEKLFEARDVIKEYVEEAQL